MTARVADVTAGRDRCDVEVERVRVDVDEHRLRAAQLDRVRRRGERVGGDDHLVARPDLEREQGEMERRGPRRDGRRVRRADRTRDRGLELLDLRAHRELPGAHDLRDRGELRVPDVRPREPDRVASSGRSSPGTTRSFARALRRGRPSPRSRGGRAPSRCSGSAARRPCSGAAGTRPRPGSP